MNYNIEKADISEGQNDIVRILSDNLPSFGGQEMYLWYYFKNPAGRGACWVIKTGAGEIAGTGGLGIRRLHIEGVPVLAGVLSDFAVYKEHRQLLPALNLQKKISEFVKSELCLAYGFPNNKAVKVMERAGYKRVGAMKRYVRILDLEPYLKRYLHPAISRALAPVLNSMYQLIFPEPHCPLKNNLQIKQVKEFDARFDSLWNNTAGEYKIIAERTCSLLNWRYNLYPGNKYTTLALMDMNEQIIFGYIVYYEKNRNICIADMLFMENELASCLLSGFINEMRKNNKQSISLACLGNGKIKKLAAKFGFSKRSEERGFVVIADPATPGLFCEDNWYLMAGDEDFN